MLRLLCRWLHEPSDWDQITRSHYRTVLHAGASEPWELEAGSGELCVTISFCGASFMVRCCISQGRREVDSHSAHSD